VPDIRNIATKHFKKLTADSFFTADFSHFKLGNIQSLFTNWQSVLESKEKSFSSKDAYQSIKQDHDLLAKNVKECFEQGFGTVTASLRNRVGAITKLIHQSNHH